MLTLTNTKCLILMNNTGKNIKYLLHSTQKSCILNPLGNLIKLKFTNSRILIKTTLGRNTNTKMLLLDTHISVDLYLVLGDYVMIYALELAISIRI